MFIPNEFDASMLCDLLMDYDDGTPEYDSAIRKLLAARDSPQDYTETDLLLMLDAIEEYFNDTNEDVTPSYDSRGLPSPYVSAVVAQRELLRNLDIQIRQHLSLLQRNT